MEQKKCTKCNNTLPLNSFHKSSERSDGYYPSCKHCRKSTTKAYYLSNSDKIKKRTFAYYETNKSEIIKKQSERNKERRKTDPIYLLKRRLRNRLYYALKNKIWKKNTHFSKYIGCNREVLISHIEKQFKPGMSWDNIGLWHIDHIVPLSFAINESDLYNLCHYTNLRPMWAKDNISKGSKVIALSKDYTVKPIDYSQASNVVENHHYSAVLPPGRYYFGLFKKETLLGVCVFSIPKSPQYRKMLTIDNGQIILELNRLALIRNIKNEATILISKAIKLLPKNVIIISYADKAHNHTGTVYQASNFKYFGLTEKRKEYDVADLHPITVGKNPEKYTNLNYRNRSRKHRYIYIKGNLYNYSMIKYKELPFPKKR